jgi:hypothetical protein
MKVIKPKQYYYSNTLVDCNLLDIRVTDNLKDCANLSLTFYTIVNNFERQVYNYALKLDGADYETYNTTTPNGNNFVIDYLKRKANIEVIGEYIKPKKETKNV